MRKTADWNLRNQESQVSKMDAMGCKNADNTDLLTHCELQMETKMRYLCAQIQTKNAALHIAKPTAEGSGGALDRLFKEI